MWECSHKYPPLYWILDPYKEHAFTDLYGAEGTQDQKQLMLPPAPGPVIIVVLRPVPSLRESL